MVTYGLVQYILIRGSDPAKKPLCAAAIEMNHFNLVWILLPGREFQSAVGKASKEFTSQVPSHQVVMQIKHTYCQQKCHCQVSF